jgi:hypothetical protein
MQVAVILIIPTRISPEAVEYVNRVLAHARNWVRKYDRDNLMLLPRVELGLKKNCCPHNPGC